MTQSMIQPKDTKKEKQPKSTNGAQAK